jgi:hypothetical protein
VAQLSALAAETLDPAQASALAEVMDLEARWENLRAGGPEPSTIDLQHRQRAYEAFRARLAAYTSRYKTLRVPELTPNGPDRLGAWYKTVRAVLCRAEPGTAYPAHVIDKAYRLADRLAARLNHPAVARGTADGIEAAVRELDGLVQWCEALDPKKPLAVEIGS